MEGESAHPGAGPAVPALDDDPELAALVQGLIGADTRAYVRLLWACLWTGQAEPVLDSLVIIGNLLDIHRRLRASATARGWSDPDPAWEQTRTRRVAQACWAYIQGLQAGSQFARRMFDHAFFGAPYPGVSGGSTLQQRIDNELRRCRRGIPASTYAALLAPDFVPRPLPNPVPAVLGPLLGGPPPARGSPQQDLWQQLRRLRTWIRDRPAADQPFAEQVFHFYFITTDEAVPIPTSSCQLDLTATLYHAWQKAADLVARLPPDPRLAAQAAYEQARARRDAEMATARERSPDDPARWTASAATLAEVTRTMDAYAALRPPHKCL